jgi:polysaccharide deacetylase 2 family uncharacterized protein YibQ
MEAEVTDPGSDGSGGSPLTALLVIAWAMTLSSFAGAVAWVLLTGDPGYANGAPPKVTMSLNSFHVADPLPNESATVDSEPPISDGPAASSAKTPAPGGETQLAAAGLHPHPDPLLIEKSDLGLLPIVGKDGRLPWRVYARPFNSVDSRPRIAVIVTGLGVSENATKSALDSLPGPVTLSFAPFTKNLPDWIDKSRAAGHEVMIDLPLEPMDYPRNDPGPNTLLTSVPIDQNLRRLGWILSRATGYVGVSIYMGSGMVAKPRVLSPILSEIKTRGLMLVDTREDPMAPATDLAKELKLAVAVSDALIDRELAAGPIDRQLAELESRARAQGAALAVARPFPLTLSRLKTWTASLNAKGIALAPVSALPAMQTKQ